MHVPQRTHHSTRSLLTSLRLLRNRANVSDSPHRSASATDTQLEGATQVLGAHDQRCGRREERARAEGRMRMEREEPSATGYDLEASLACTGSLFRDECGCALTARTSAVMHDVVRGWHKR
jgi:hypothetical protein